MHRRVDGKWQSLIEFTDEEMEEVFYSLNGELDAAVEKKWNSRLVVCGPLIHDYILEFGSGMLNRLQRGKITGIQSTNLVMVPWTIMVNLTQLAKGYGAELNITKKHHEKLFKVHINTEYTGRKIWNFKRCNKNFLSNRRCITDASGADVYSGCSNVVITPRTPIIITYITKTKKASLSFYIQ